MNDEQGFQMKPIRDGTRTVEVNFLNPLGEWKKETREYKISELCQRCPFMKCSGCYQKNCSNACETMIRWREGELTDREAVEKKWDEFRKRLYPKQKKIHDF